VEKSLVVVEAAEDAVATTIRGTHASRANRAGKFSCFLKQPDVWKCGREPQAIKTKEEL
jgi:hypothetical protein